MPTLSRVPPDSAPSMKKKSTYVLPYIAGVLFMIAGFFPLTAKPLENWRRISYIATGAFWIVIGASAQRKYQKSGD